ncbi:MAG TPA: isoprenylcysteine carboxylmethyltransferase family protein [Dehalococcoidia bacterium]|nr:isoprenylcysteine carboxylmethyltransferase family protein [Dehalococcoidia bacterium]
MRAVDIGIGAAWAAFWLYWLAAAATSKRTASRSAQGVAVRLVIAIVAALIIRVSGWFDHATFNGNPAMAAAGVVLFVLGLALAVWARVHLGRNWGTPMSEKAEPELVTSGPYRRIRHPIYSGIILASIGTALAVTWYWLIVAALIAVYFVYSATVEERIMTRLFPNAYPPYRRSTKMLVPFLL